MPVNSTHAQYDKWASKWQRCRDAAAGQDAVHAAGKKYLPMLGGQDSNEYDAYKMRASFYGATGRTIDGLSGMLFRKPLNVELPAAIKSFEDDITRDGQSLHSFAECAAQEQLEVGRLGILVDHPPAMPVVSLADARAMRFRPYLRLYKAESIINWKLTDGVLTMVVLHEKAEIAEDEFKAGSEDRWRVLDMVGGAYRQRVYKRGEKDGEFVQVGGDIFPMMQGRRISYIPFVFAGERDQSSDISPPPLLSLVNVNLSHYRTTADYEHGLHWCGCPTPWISGYTLEPGQRLTIGSGEAWVFPAADAKAGMLELKADSLGALEKALERKEGQMAALGARILSPEKKAAETAETAAIHRGGEISVLSSLAQSLSGAIEWALQILNEWAGGSGDVICQINRDYLPRAMDASEILALLQSWQAGAMSHKTLYDAFVEGEVIKKPDSLEDELERIADNPPGMGMGAGGAV